MSLPYNWDESWQQLRQIFHNTREWTSAGLFEKHAMLWLDRDALKRAVFAFRACLLTRRLDQIFQLNPAVYYRKFLNYKILCRKVWCQ